VAVLIGAVHTSISFWMFGISDEGVAAIVIYAVLCEIYIFVFALGNLKRLRIVDVAPAGRGQGR
jgi:hypothetical protein